MGLTESEFRDKFTDGDDIHVTHIPDCAFDEQYATVQVVVRVDKLAAAADAWRVRSAGDSMDACILAGIMLNDGIHRNVETAERMRTLREHMDPAVRPHRDAIMEGAQRMHDQYMIENAPPPELQDEAGY